MVAASRARLSSSGYWDWSLELTSEFTRSSMSCACFACSSLNFSSRCSSPLVRDSISCSCLSFRELKSDSACCRSFERMLSPTSNSWSQAGQVAVRDEAVVSIAARDEKVFRIAIRFAVIRLVRASQGVWVSNKRYCLLLINQWLIIIRPTSLAC